MNTLSRFNIYTGVYIFLFDPQKYGQITGWGKNGWKEMKKRGENAYFFPNLLKIYKIAQKKAENFSPAASTSSLY